MKRRKVDAKRLDMGGKLFASVAFRISRRLSDGRSLVFFLPLMLMSYFLYDCLTYGCGSCFKSGRSEPISTEVYYVPEQLLFDPI